MSWVRLDDNFHWHPKVAPLSDGAYRLYVGSLCYCNRFSRGDSVTLQEVLGLVGNARKARRLIDELLRARLWAESESGWQIHDYFLYQPDPKKVLAGRARAQQMLSERSAPSRPVPSRPVTGVENPSVGSPTITDGIRVLTKPYRGSYKGGEFDRLSATLPTLRHEAGK